MLNDEEDLKKMPEPELRARVGSYMAFAQVILKGYNALRSYGVDMFALPEWKDMGDLDEARKMKPIPAQQKVIGWITRLDHAISAAIRRKQLRGLQGGRPEDNTTNH